MCPGRYMKSSGSHISKGLWKKLIDEISHTSPHSTVIPFWRGESLLHPAFAELLEYALTRPLKIHISTNGHDLTKEQSHILARCEFVTFSIHTMRGYANAKKFLGDKKGKGPIVQVSFVKGEQTTDKILPEILASPDLSGFDSIRLYEEHTKGGVFGMATSVSAPVQRSFCKKLLNTLVIACDGTVSRCNHIWETENGIDLKETGISDAWTSDILKRIRKDYPDSRCGTCDQWIGHTLGESWRIVEGKVEHHVFAAGQSL